MKFVITVLALLALISSSFAQQHVEQGGTNLSRQPQAEGEGWYKQNSHSATSIPSVFFINKDTGWVGTIEGCFGTINGGDTWELYSLQGVVYPHFIDGKNGIANGDTSLVRTFDGGYTWVPIGTRCPIKGQLQAFGLDTIRIGNDRKTASTNDGGKTWINPSVPFGGSIHFVSGQMGFRCGDQYVWLGDPPPAKGTNGASFEYTTDGGGSWHAKFCEIQQDLWSIFAINEKHIVLSGTGKTFAYTMNGGEPFTWNIALNQAGVYAESLFFINGQTGYSAGSLGNIAMTTDSGKTWLGQNSTVSSDLRCIFFIDTLNGWASGYEGTILHTINGGKLWVRQYLPFDSIIVQTYPEPAQNITSVHYTIPSPQHVTLRIYDPSGREVAAPLANVHQAQGEHTIPVNLAMLSAGAYFLRFESEKYRSTIRITIVR
jgi:photosystem II stability/assembly factor-like uncharacterized protein